MSKLCRLVFGLFFILTACGAPLGRGSASPRNLASFTESEVKVDIFLEWDENSQPWLTATFTPEKGDHLYSKNLPRNGVDGLGRPTLLELVPGSLIQPAGELGESVAAVQDESQAGLLVYPPGPVTLRLPIVLPEGEGWYDEQVTVTYMACSDGSCCPPVVGKLVPLRVPGAQEIGEP